MGQMLSAIAMAITLSRLLTSGTVTPAPNAERLFEQGQEYLNTNCLHVAASTLEEYLRTTPRSLKAPEAAYQLACAHLLLGKPDDAQKAFARVVRDYFDSPWGQVAALVHLPPKTLMELANEKRLEGRDKRQGSSLQCALRLYQLCLRPSAPGQPGSDNTPNKNEVLYRIADCLARLGQEGDADTVLTQVQKDDKDGNWGLMATLKTGDCRVFQRRMDDLMKACGDDDDRYQLFLDWFNSYSALLPEADRLKGRYYQAIALGGLKKETQSLTLLESICRENPTSTWAAEAAFLLAEKAHVDGDLDQAAHRYRQLAQQHPTCRWAKLAQQWATDLEHRAKTQPELERLAQRLIDRINNFHSGLAFTITTDILGADKPCKIRLAHQSDTEYVLQVQLDKFQLMYAANSSGEWLYNSDQAQIIHARKRVPIPVPHFTTYMDTAVGRPATSFQWGIGDSAPPPTTKPLEVAEDLRPVLIPHLQKSMHLHLEKLGQGHLVRMQLASWKQDQPTTLEIELDSADNLQRVRWLSWKDKDKTTWNVADVCLGGSLSPKLLAFTLPAGLPVREVDEANPFELVGSYMKLIGVLGEKVMQATR